MTHRRFQLVRHEDITGISGTGIVAEGVEFSDGSVALRWTAEWPTSVVFHERGMESVEHVHGHGGSTEIVWLDEVAHNPWDAWCSRRVMGEPTKTDARCQLCRAKRARDGLELDEAVAP